MNMMTKTLDLAQLNQQRLQLLLERNLYRQLHELECQKRKHERFCLVMMIILLSIALALSLLFGLGATQ